MRQTVKGKMSVLISVLAILSVLCFSGAASAALFSDGRYVRLDYATGTALGNTREGDVMEPPGEGNDGDESGGCTCEQNTGSCFCGTVNVGCECSHDKSGVLRIVSDNVHYLVMRQPFILDLEAEGGKAPYSWEINGALPEGLSFSEDGMLEGTPIAPGSFSVTVQVSDSAAKYASRRFSFLVVEDEKLAVMTDTLPGAQVGRFYTAKVRGCGGTKPYGWEIENLPDWLQLDPQSGILSGVPTNSTIHDLMVRLNDNDGTSESALLRLSVYPHDGLDMTTRVLPAAVYGQGYSVRLEASGGISPYFFTLRRNSSLPPGLTLESSGEIFGWPEQKGAYDFTVDAIDGNSLQGSALYTMVVLGEDSAKSFEFLAEELESEKRLLLSFYLPKEFNEASVLSIEALTSPDLYTAGTNSSITRETNGAYSVILTLHIAEQALSDFGNWMTVMDKLAVDAIVVKFENASGSEVRFEQALAVKDMRREADSAERGDGGGSGGCDSIGLNLLAFLFLHLYLRANKATKTR